MDCFQDLDMLGRAINYLIGVLYWILYTIISGRENLIFPQWNDKKDWVIASIGEIIQIGTENDNKAFDPAHFPKAEKIIFHLANCLKEQLTVEGHRYVDHPLNSPEGKLITALIFLSLRQKRIALKANQNAKFKWKKQFKNSYDNLMSKPVIDSFILFGFYLNQFAYLDKKWTKTQIKKLELLEVNNSLWTGFMNAMVSKQISAMIYLI
jgi:hypothetical protein